MIQELRFVHGIIANVKASEITATNALARGKIGKRSKSGQPMCKRRLEGQYQVTRKDLSRLEMLAAGNPLKTKFRDVLQAGREGITVVFEELKQRICAGEKKLRDTRTG